MVHYIRNAGLGLSFLFMTVLSLSNITYGFCLAQCVTEWLLGVLVGVSAIFGVIGSLSFPYLRKRIGLPKTGMFGMVSLLTSLSLCIVSIWLDGSPFDPHYYTNKNGTQNYPEITPKNNYSQIGEIGIRNGSLLLLLDNNDVQKCDNFNFLSVSVLLSGIILARFGLWISDLTITQIIQESHQHRLNMNHLCITYY